MRDGTAMPPIRHHRLLSATTFFPRLSPPPPSPPSPLPLIFFVLVSQSPRLKGKFIVHRMSGHANYADRHNTTEWEFISQNLLAFDLSRFTRFLSESKRKKKEEKRIFRFSISLFSFFFSRRFHRGNERSNDRIFPLTGNSILFDTARSSFHRNVERKKEKRIRMQDERLGLRSTLIRKEIFLLFCLIR